MLNYKQNYIQNSDANYGSSKVDLIISIAGFTRDVEQKTLKVRKKNIFYWIYHRTMKNFTSKYLLLK